MSLIKQLWMAVLAIVLLAFTSGFLVSGINARAYYEEQLSVKNIDAATSMALTLSPMDKDEITIELALSSQFDTGHYRTIRLLAADGSEAFVKQASAVKEAPRWFARLIGFDVPVGVAQVQDGWNLYGTLYVESETEYALAALWKTSLWLLFWFSLVAMVCGMAGTIIMYIVNRPFSKVIEQAEALGERRFITSVVPKTTEFKRLVSAMNQLTERVKGMLDKEASKFDELRKKTQLDEVMQIANREAFMAVLKARLDSQKPVKDALLILRIQNLEHINQELGRVEADRWLQGIATTCQTYLSEQVDSFGRYQLGRLNGRDVAILLTENANLQEIAEGLLEHFEKHCALADGSLPLILVGSHYQNEDLLSTLMAGLDQQLVDLETTQNKLAITDYSNQEMLYTTGDEWRYFFQQALANDKVSAAYFPVYRLDGSEVHNEALLRIQDAQQSLTAQSVIGWARRVGALPLLELQMLRNALSQAKQHSQNIALNISMSSLLDRQFYNGLQQIFSNESSAVLAQIIFEFDEHTVVREPVLFAGLAGLIKRYGGKIGLQSVGQQFSEISEVERLGFEYLKVDAALIQASQEESVQAMLRSLCKLGQSLGFMMIAEGVKESVDCILLEEIGFDAFSGPGSAQCAKS